MINETFEMEYIYRKKNNISKEIINFIYELNDNNNDDDDI